MARLCTATTKNTKKPCPNREGFFGLGFDAEGRCACHTTDPELRAAFQATRREGSYTRRVPRTAADAMKLAAGAARQVSLGKLGLEEAKALTGLLKEFRELLQIDVLVKARDRKQKQQKATPTA